MYYYILWLAWGTLRNLPKCCTDIEVGTNVHLESSIEEGPNNINDLHWSYIRSRLKYSLYPKTEILSYCLQQRCTFTSLPPLQRILHKIGGESRKWEGKKKQIKWRKLAQGMTIPHAPVIISLSAVSYLSPLQRERDHCWGESSSY